MIWEYIKGSEADFEGAPEWATLRARKYWYESGKIGEGRYVYTEMPSVEGLNPVLNHSALIIAERRKVDNLQSRVNEANLGDALKEMFDTVQRPAHYSQSDIECIDAIKASMTLAEFQSYLKGNVLKYLWRYRHKNGLEDVKKAQWYINRLATELEESEKEDKE